MKRPCPSVVTPGLLAALLLAGGAAGCRRAAPAAADAPIPVRVRAVERRLMKRTLDYAGTIRAAEEATVFPKVAGKVKAKLKDEGAPVAKDEALAVIDRDEVGFTYEPAPVESPLAGIVGRMFVDLGTAVTPQTPIALVVAMDTVELLVQAPEHYLPGIHTGQTVECAVSAWPGAVFTGRVTQVSPIVDLETRAAPVEVTLPNAGHRLSPGMFARARLILEAHPGAPAIPHEAILGRSPDEYVYVVSNGLAATRDVRTGLREGALVEITAGLQPGDPVVIMGQQRLHTGVRVTTDADPSATD